MRENDRWRVLASRVRPRVMTLRLAFMGTPDFAAPALSEIVAAGHDVVAVYTQPPRPAGRGQSLRKSPVHQLADDLGLEVRTPTSMRDDVEVEAFKALELDIAVVVAYGQILPKPVLEAPRLGCINLHASLLPRWRGAAPIQRAIMAGDAETGVQVMRMEEGLDTGAVILSETVVIRDDDTSGALHDRLAQIGAGLAPRALAALERGAAVETPQAETGVTYAKKIDKSEARIDWSKPAVEIDRLIRGLSPFPGAWFEAEGARGPLRVKALGSQRADGAGASGELLDADMTIACGEGAIRLTRGQREGRSAQPGEELFRALNLQTGGRVT